MTQLVRGFVVAALALALGCSTSPTPSQGDGSTNSSDGASAPNVDSPIGLGAEAGTIGPDGALAPNVDSPIGPGATEAGAIQYDGLPDMVGIDAGAVRACTTTSTKPGPKSCRSVTDCGPTGPVKCCTSSPCWPESACPIPPSMCAGGAGGFLCNVDSDCAVGGKCVSGKRGCPQCEYRECKNPPPACTASPDSCAPAGKCQPSGVCAPIPCTQGYACPADTRCNAGAPRADAHGCEEVPCTQGWTCPENSRCTAPSTTENHGCVSLACAADHDCDCGFCVFGVCSANLGWCEQAPS